MTTPLLISAAPFEVAATIHALASLHFAFDYQRIGIGPFPLEQSHPNLSIIAKDRDVIFIGTCGIFGAFTEPRLVIAEQAHWLPTCERHQLSYQAAQPLPPISWKMAAKNPAPPVETCIAICAPNVSLSDQLPVEYLQKSTSVVETIELYRVATLVQPVAKSFCVLLGITNSVGPHAREQWRENHAKCAQMSAAFVANYWTSFSSP